MKVWENFTNFAFNVHLVLFHASAINSYMSKYAEKGIAAFENYIILE